MCLARAIWFGWLFLLVSIGIHGADLTNVVQLACNRNPKLPICITLKVTSTKHMPRNFRSTVIPGGHIWSDDSVDITKYHTSYEERVESVNVDSTTTSVMPSETDYTMDASTVTTTTSAEMDKTAADVITTSTKPVYSGSHIDVTKSQFIRLRAYASIVDNLKANPFVGRSKTTLLERSKERYCHTYIPKFTFYCQGPGRLTIPAERQPKLAAFCSSVKDTCFSEKITPCTPDCDEQINSHCTASCKCDYLYPLIVKFCAPLAVPFLENVCRSWFYGCAKMYALDIMDVDTFLFPPNVRSPWTKDDVPPLGALKNPRHRIHQAKNFPIVSNDVDVPSNNFHKFDQFTDQSGVLHRPRSRSPWSKPGLWEANPDNPHNRDHANKFYYAPRSVTADWLSGQVQWGAHWAVPAAGVGGTDGFSALHFPSIGNFLNIADDYD